LGGEFFQGLTLFSGIDRAYQFGRYLLYGDICAKTGYALKQPEVAPCFHCPLPMYSNFYAASCIKDSIGRHMKLLHGEEGNLWANTIWRKSDFACYYV